MSETNYELDDGLDDLFSDLDDLDISENPDPPEFGTRQAISAVASGAFEAIKDVDSLADVGKHALRKALPEGYIATWDAADEALASATKLYDNVKKPLEKPLKALKKTLYKKADQLPDWIGEANKEHIKDLTRVEDDEPTYRSIDPDQSAVDMALEAVFRMTEQQSELQRGQASLQEVEAEQAVGDHALQLTMNSNIARLANYQDGVNYRYQKRSLELQHLQYFAARDLLAVVKGMAEDDRTDLKSIIHNTSLPDFQKIQLAEGYQQYSLDHLFGKVNDSIHEYSDRFLPRMWERLQKKGVTAAKGIGSNLGVMNDALSGLGQGPEMGDEEKAMVAGQMATQTLIEYLGPKLGSRLGKLLEKNQVAKRQSARLLYLVENFPGVFRKSLKDWDGGLLPETLVRRFPFLESVNEVTKVAGETVRDELRDLTKGMASQDITIAQTLRDNGQEMVPWDLLSRRSLVEIIPGYLSRQTQFLEMIATGNDDVQRQVFSMDTESFERIGDVATRLETNLNEELGRRRQRLSDALVKTLGVGSGVELSPEARKVLTRHLENMALNNTPFSLEAIRDARYGDPGVADEIKNLIDSSRGNDSLRELSGARVLREMARGQKELQARVNQMYASGETDVLREAGLVTNRYGESRFDNARLHDVLFDRADATEQPVIPETQFNNPKPIGPTLDYEGLHATFFEPFRNTQAIPVFTPDDDDTPEAVNPLNGVVQEGFEATIALLTSINEAILSPDKPADGGEVKKRAGFMRFLNPGNILTGFGNFTKSYYDGVSNLTGTLAGVAGNTATGIWDRTFGRFGRNKGETVTDVHLAGERTPILKAKDIVAGRYRDQETNKVIRSLKDITGPVVDEDDNVVVSQVDIDRGLFSPTGVSLKDVIGTIKAPFSHALDFQNMSMGLASGLLRRTVGGIMDGVSNFNNRVRDIYVIGDSMPRLYAYAMKNGAYFSKATGKRIYHQDEIDGEIVDAEGNTVLSMADLNAGLVDNIGTPIGGSRLKQVVKNVFGAAKDLTFGVIQNGIDSGNLVLKNFRDFTTGVLDRVRPQTKATVESHDILVSIYEYMQARWPMDGSDPVSSAIAHDMDGDGDRDGSWQDIMGNRSAETKTVPGGTHERPVDEPKAENENKGLFGLIGGMVSSLASGIPALLEIVGGIGTTILAWFGYEKAKDAATAAGDAFDGLGTGGDGKGKGGGKGPKAKGGIFSRAAKGLWGGIKAAGRGVVAAGSAVATAARVAAPVLVRGAAVVGSAMTTGVVAPAIAVAGAAYGGYQAYQYVSKRLSPEPLEVLRYLQYGFDPADEDWLPRIRELEAAVYDEITWTGVEPKFNISIVEATKRWAENWDVDMADPTQYNQWATWFARRFYPVFMTHARAARAIDPSLDLLDIDDEIAAASRQGFIRTVSLKTGFRAKGDPYAVVASPFPGETLQTNEAAIRQHVENLLNGATVTKDKPVEIKPDGSATAVKTAGAMAEASLIRKQSGKSDYTVTTAREIDPTKPSVIAKAASRGGLDTASVSTTATGAATATALGVDGVSGPTMPTPASGFRLMMPTQGRISSPFGMRIHPITGTRKQHKGVDIAAPTGTPIVAGADGVIIRRYFSKSYGRVVYLKHSNGMATRYAHMSAFVDGQAVGQRVRKGQLIGYVGNSGISAGPHLHWELRKTANQWAEALDPLKYTEGHYSRDVTKEEKALVKQEKEHGGKAGESLEGHDTVASTALDRPVDTPSAPIPSAPAPAAAASAPVPQTSREKAVMERAAAPVVSPEELQRKEIAKGNQVVSDALRASQEDNQNAFKQRKALIEGQTLTNNHLASMVELLQAMATQEKQRNTGRTTSRRSSSSNRNEQYEPIVDLRD